jgi:hypothetical protein
MRKVRFSAAFWPEMHEHLQRRRAGGSPLDAEFHEALAMTLSELADDSMHIIRFNFIKYPLMEGDAAWRTARVTQEAELVWTLTGAAHGETMPQLAGCHIRGMRFRGGDGEMTTVGYIG